MANVVTLGYIARHFDIRTPPSASYLSLAECLVLCVLAVEDYLSIYRALMRPLDLMLEKWNNFSNNREQGGRRFFSFATFRPRGGTLS